MEHSSESCQFLEGEAVLFIHFPCLRHVSKVWLIFHFFLAMVVQSRCWLKISSDQRLYCAHFCGITLICLFYSLSARISYFLISSLLQYFPFFILCIADTLLSARLGPKMLGFFLYWQMIQSLNRLFVFQRVPPTPYNSTLVAVHSMCSLNIHARFVLVCEPEKMTSGQWAFQPPPRLCPKTRFSVSVLCCFGAVCSYICI